MPAADARPPEVRQSEGKRLISPRLAMWLAIAAGAALGFGALHVWRNVQIGKPDERYASLCRSVIPALNPDGARFTLAAPRRAKGDGVRVAYVATFPDGRVRAREVNCRFEPAKNGAAPARLAGVATERGPLSEANFYFLKRFYLEASDGPPPDPAASQATAPAAGP